MLKGQFFLYSRVFGVMFALLSTTLAGVFVFWWVSAPVRPRIAFLIAANLYNDRLAYEGFLKKRSLVAGGERYDVQPFYFHGNRDESLQAAVAQMQGWGPSLIVACGYYAAPRIALLLPKIPLVFIGVDDCIARGLVDSLQSPGNKVSGVIAAEYDVAVMAYMLQAVKPGARAVLIPYDVADDVGGLVAHTIEWVTSILSPFNIRVTALPLTDMAQASAAIKPQLSEHDVLLTLEIDPLDDILGELVALCNATKTTLFVGTMGGVEAGAVLSFGGHMQVLGKAAFVQADAFMRGAGGGKGVPIARVSGHRQFVLNSAVAMAQGLGCPQEEAIRLRMLRFENNAPYLPNFKFL